MTHKLPAPIADTGRKRFAAADIHALLEERILVLDGGMGTAIFPLNLGASDYGGEDLLGCPEALNLTRPDAIQKIHADYFAAGADIVETNTFGGTPIVLDEYQLGHLTYDVNVAAARIAARAALAASKPGRPKLVAGSIGPTTKTLSVTGGVTFEQMLATYDEQVRGLVDGGVDLLLVETCLDTLNAKAALLACRKYLAQAGLDVPVMLSCTIEAMGTMLAGQTVEGYYTSTEHGHPLSVGMNCSTGPEFMTDHIRALSGLAWTYVSCYPNAGLPDENGQYHETPDQFSSKLGRFVENGWLNIVGGCCGTHAGHIQAVSQMVEGKAPRRPRVERSLSLSGVDFLQPDDSNRPIIVGERTNSLGSRLFRQLIVEEKFEEAAEIGRRQMKGGAQVLDICLQNADRDEVADVTRFLEILVKKVRLPLMIDSTDPRVVELALKYFQGKGVVNSINLEDGEEKLERICPLLRAYGAAVVVGCIDEDKQQGQAITPERKVEIAQRSYDLLTRKYGIPARDIIFDPLVFPAGTGDKNYVGSAAHTIDGVRRIKEALPDTHTILGISNVSFGLPASGREVMNSVFLYHCTKAGLDFAIVNSEKLVRYASIPDDERKVAEDVIFNRGADPVAAFAALFRSKGEGAGAKKKEVVASTLSLEERIARRIVEGTKDGMIPDLDLALKKYTPLEVVNGPLMAGMDEVGRLFGANELIVSEVLQSAEAMKAAVGYLEKFMTKTDAASRGKIVLATVKGDVHDIGKNLVEIILANNGYQVVNLGIKVPSEALIEAFRQHKPDAIGLSGLLVKSAQQMVATAADFRAAGVDCPVLVGGAALTRKFTYTRIAPEHAGATLYAREAMEGLDLMNQLTDAKARGALIDRVRAEQAAMAADGGAKPPAPAACTPQAARATSKIRRDVTVPQPPDLKRHVIEDASLDEIARYLNPQMLYGKHLGLKGSFERLREQGDAKALELEKVVEEVLSSAQANRWMSARAVWKFFPAHAEGDDLVLLAPGGGSEIERFSFPRQPGGERLCLADFVRPAGSGGPDYVALFVTTTGVGLREHVERLKASGEYLRCHALQALAIELAEAFAEELHTKLRAMWGFADPAGMTMSDRFKAKYRGLRVSFGYPACPRLEDQEKLFRLLDPDSIGVKLTEGHMMEPEASVSALVFHHPEARYFNADAGAAETTSGVANQLPASASEALR